MNIYGEGLAGINHWVKVLNEGEKGGPPYSEDLSVYLGDIPVYLSGSSGAVVGYLTDAVGVGAWSFVTKAEHDA